MATVVEEQAIATMGVAIKAIEFKNECINLVKAVAKGNDTDWMKTRMIEEIIKRYEIKMSTII